MAGKRPEYRIRYPLEREGKTTWISLGAAWVNNETDAIQVRFDSMPINFTGVVYLMPIDWEKERSDE